MRVLLVVSCLLPICACNRVPPAARKAAQEAVIGAEKNVVKEVPKRTEGGWSKVGKEVGQFGAEKSMDYAKDQLTGKKKNEK